MIYPITPVPAPRQSRRDAWAPRPEVLRYRAFRDEVLFRKVEVPEDGAAITFVMPMPKSWGKHKKAAMVGQLHKQKPDLDNLLKALVDAVYCDDCMVSSYAGVRKIWGYEGSIIIE